MGGDPGPPGRTQDFVAARGFEDRAGRVLLLDSDGRGRVLLELTTDADHPHSEPPAAYESLLSTLEPGAQVRFLQILWPDGVPRAAFIRQAAGWPAPEQPFMRELSSDLTSHLSQAPLPYLRRTILEAVLLNDEMWEWVGGAIEILKSYGLNARLLEPADVLELAQWVFNPELD
jgi:hypothetical protein